MAGSDLRAVAAHAGVSVSTASRALAGSPRISPATRARVAGAATALGYRPNATARALRVRRSQLAGLVITNLGNTSLHTVAEAVQRRLAEAGLHLVLSVTHGDPEQERAAVATLVDHRAVGVVVVGDDAQATTELASARIPVVHLARRPPEPVGDCVLVDDEHGAGAATEHLLAHGHRRVALVAGPAEVTSGRERREGYERALQRAGVEVDEALVVSGPFSPAFGAQAVAGLLDVPPAQRPTALLVSNAEAATGVLVTLRERGTAVPAGLSVVCYEDSDLLRWWQPAITVVDVDAGRMGELAAARLLERIEDPDIPGTELRVRTRLVQRASVGRMSQPCAPSSRPPSTSAAPRWS